MSEARGRTYLEQLRRILPPSPAWDAWLAKSGELPPDFEALPAVPELPDSLTPTVDGHSAPITNYSEWDLRREELKALFHHWVIGSTPRAPDNLRAEVIEERVEPGATVRKVRMTFGPEGRANLRLELLIPDGAGPFPVFMTQHNHRGWALIALRRGYLGCVYAGADSEDDTDSFVEAYPEHDWSRITRRAWAASRCVDYLAETPESDGGRIALTGHSRNGKLSVIAAALDARFSAVISSSSGAGGVLPFRYFSEQHGGEGIEMLTRVFPDWFHPRLRFFTGREERLPIDMHQLLALVAPRPCLLSTALNDGCESAWAVEETYRAARDVYRFLDAGEELSILHRPGGHETWPAIIERYLDWLDDRFDRGGSAFMERLIFPFDREARRPAPADRGSADRIYIGGSSSDSGRAAADESLASGAAFEWPEKRRAIRGAILELLGEEPSEAENSGGGYGEEPGHIAMLLGRLTPGEGVEKEQIVFGEYLNGDVYRPAGLRQTGDRAPAVLWLHPFSYSHGYCMAYRRSEQIHRTLARHGFVVFCFDQIGFGRRIEEIEGFYDRHPRWSVLGKMVRDSRAALTSLSVLPYVDPGRIFGLGYNLGSMVGLHAAALDDRLAGFASVCGPAPFRLDTEEKGGIRRWSRSPGVYPQLGLFAGNEDALPYDTPHLYATLAPKPLLIVSPQLDREAPVADVGSAVEAARSVYAVHDAAGRLEQHSPETYHQFGPEIQEYVLGWLERRRGE